jgi:hypothetical protein
MVFLHHSSVEKMVHNTKGGQLLHWHDEGRKELIIRKMESLDTPQMQHNGVTLIPTSHGLATQGAYGLL